DARDLRLEGAERGARPRALHRRDAPGLRPRAVRVAPPDTTHERQRDERPGLGDQLDRHPRSCPWDPPDPLPRPGGREDVHRQGRSLPMMRRPAVMLLGVLLAGALAVGAIIVTRPRSEEAGGGTPSAVVGEDLLLLVLRNADEPFSAV